MWVENKLRGALAQQITAQRQAHEAHEAQLDEILMRATRQSTSLESALEERLRFSERRVEALEKEKVLWSKEKVMMAEEVCKAEVEIESKKKLLEVPTLPSIAPADSHTAA